MKTNINGVNIIVDKRTELLGIIMFISNYHNIWKDSGQFENCANRFLIDEICNKFSKYKNENTIKLFDELTEDGDFSFDAPFALFLQLDENYKVDKLNDYVFKDRLKSNPKVFEFIDSLSDFADKIGFEEYYNNHQEEYKKYIKSMAKAFEMYDVNDFFKNYYGYDSQKEFNVVLTPFITRCAFSCDINDKIYSCIPVYPHSKKENLYDISGAEKNFLTLPIHEFCHGYINPLTDEYKMVDYTTDLFEDIKEEMIKQAYPTDVEILNEHIVRAITARSILYMSQDNELYNRELKRQKDCGFIYINCIIKSLEEYESNRNKYKTFVDFYPKIIDSIKLEKENTKIR